MNSFRLLLTVIVLAIAITDERKIKRRGRTTSRLPVDREVPNTIQIAPDPIEEGYPRKHLPKYQIIPQRNSKQRIEPKNQTINRCQTKS